MTLLFGLGVLAITAIWQRLMPFRSPVKEHNRNVNICLWIANISLAAALLVAPDQCRAPWQTSALLALPLGFLLLDALAWAIHRMQHMVPWLWRLHRLHHSESELEWSSAVRHHPVEGLISTSIFWLFILASGIPGWVSGIHSAATLALAFLTHANIRWPNAIERLARPVLITLQLHEVHHGVEAVQQANNFGAVLSLWDRLAGTLSLPRADCELRFGLSSRPSVRVLLFAPWRI